MWAPGGQERGPLLARTCIGKVTSDALPPYFSPANGGKHKEPENSLSCVWQLLLFAVHPKAHFDS